MVDEDLCAQMTCGLVPAVDLKTLLEVARWIEQLPSTCATHTQGTVDL
jgi:hypothetical protein